MKTLSISLQKTNGPGLKNGRFFSWLKISDEPNHPSMVGEEESFNQEKIYRSLCQGNFFMADSINFRTGDPEK